MVCGGFHYMWLVKSWTPHGLMPHGKWDSSA